MNVCWQAPDGGIIVGLEVLDNSEECLSLAVTTDKGNLYIVPKESLDLSQSQPEGWTPTW